MAFGDTSSFLPYYILQMMKGDRDFANAFKCALFKNTVTPSKTGTTYDESKYGTSATVWKTTTEVTTGDGYTHGGKTLTVSTSQAATILKWISTTSPTWTSATITSYGCIVYDTTSGATEVTLVATYNSFSGEQAVTSGTFKVTFDATGIGKITV